MHNNVDRSKYAYPNSFPTIAVLAGVQVSPSLQLTITISMEGWKGGHSNKTKWKKGTTAFSRPQTKEKPKKTHTHAQKKNQGVDRD